MITVSVVSHGHGAMVWSLVDQLLGCSLVSQILVTCNVVEACPSDLPDCVEVITNLQPKGFGANHNTAFLKVQTEYFCVLNPDVQFLEDPFPGLLQALQGADCAIVAPLARNHQGGIEDNFRTFPTLTSLLLRLLGRRCSGYTYDAGSTRFSADWVAGMFMLMPSGCYARLGGFDERYFLYYEDVDLCRRLRAQGGDILACPDIVVVHEGRRASHEDPQHFCWHIRSMSRYLLTRAHLLRPQQTVVGR